MRLYLLTFIIGCLLVTQGSAQNLDLREANVTRVEYSSNETTYTFDVTLYHDDSGETPNYADLWVVEDLDGNELIRRELLHSHGTVEFTRSATGTIPEGTTKLVVRGYDQIHEWGGQVSLVDLETEKLRYIDQGSERQDFEESDYGDSFVSDSTQDEVTLSGTLVVLGIFLLTRRRQENLL